MDMPGNQVICKGIIERLGQENTALKYQNGIKTLNQDTHFKDHREGLLAIIALLTDTTDGVVKSTSEIQVVGHRVVHGGSIYDGPVKVSPKVLKTIQELSSLAPLHNPANAIGIEVATTLFPNAVQVAVFDTAFHQSLPKKAFNYAIPRELALKNNIRAYGFHGTSHKYVSEKALGYLAMNKAKMISIHLGNGCSITALKDGKSVEHSLGFGPSNGLIMGTRSGDIDQSLIFHLIDSLGYQSEQVNTMLQKQSGLLGLTGFSDFRDILSAAEKGDENSVLALEMTAHRIKKYIGAYATLLNGLDAIVFTAGIGENAPSLRKMVCADMDILGIALNPDKNEKAIGLDTISEIQHEDSKVKVLVIPTDEEYEIAKQSYDLVSGNPL